MRPKRVPYVQNWLITKLTVQNGHYDPIFIFLFLFFFFSCFFFVSWSRQKTNYRTDFNEIWYVIVFLVINLLGTRIFLKSHNLTTLPLFQNFWNVLGVLSTFLEFFVINSNYILNFFFFQAVLLHVACEAFLFMYIDN